MTALFPNDADPYTILQFRDFPETGTGCHDDDQTRDASHISCHVILRDTLHLRIHTPARAVHAAQNDDDTSICVCFTVRVFSLGFMMSFSKAESQCENIFATPEEKRAEQSCAGAGLGFVRHNLTFNVEINFKI